MMQAASEMRHRNAEDDPLFHELSVGVVLLLYPRRKKIATDFDPLREISIRRQVPILNIHDRKSKGRTCWEIRLIAPRQVRLTSEQRSAMIDVFNAADADYHEADTEHGEVIVTVTVATAASAEQIVAELHRITGGRLALRQS